MSTLQATASRPFTTLAAALRSHGGDPPTAGWRMHMPCAHASWLPTRRAGQTTGSMIASAGAVPRVWMTGTSSPCLSVFKPVAVDHDALQGRGVAQATPDQGLWWAHEHPPVQALAAHHPRRLFIDGGAHIGGGPALQLGEAAEKSFNGFALAVVGPGKNGLDAQAFIEAGETGLLQVAAVEKL